MTDSTLAITDEHRGSGFGLSELAIVLEVQGSHLAPGPFLPPVPASTVIDRFATEPVRAELLPALADGNSAAAVGLSSMVVLGSDLVASGECHAVLGAPDADVLVLRAGDDLIVVDAVSAGVEVTRLVGLDSSRSVGEVALRSVAVPEDRILRGAAHHAGTVFRILAAAEALGVVSATLEMATDYAKMREQFGRPIATFQA